MRDLRRNSGDTLQALHPGRGEAPRPAPAPEEPRAVDDGQRTVIVVEDDPSVRSLMARILEREGFRVLQARQGLEALDIFRTQGHEIDLMVTDVRMALMSGTDLADALLADWPSLRVLFVTGYPDDRTAGAHWLVKPFRREEFLRAVRYLLEGEEPLFV